jgi:virginiamycin B lyase
LQLPVLIGLSRRSKKNKMRSITTAFIVAIIILGSLAAYFTYQSVVAKSTQGNVQTTVTTPYKALDSPYIKEFNLSTSSAPNGIAVDSNGNAWFVAQGNDSLGVVYANNYTTRLFKVPTKNITSWGVAVDSTRNVVWFTDYTSDAVWSFNITSSAFHEYPITTNSFAFPSAIEVDQNHNVWFTEQYADKLAEIFPVNGTIKEYPVPPPLSNVQDSGPVGLTISPNGTIWFTDTIATSVGSFSNGVFHEYNLTGSILLPVGIALDAKGDLWFTEHGPSLISEFVPSNGTVRSISTSLAPAPLYESLPYYCYIDSQGNVWFNEHQGNRIGRYSPNNNSLVEYEIPTRVGGAYTGLSGSLTMALSPSGVPWFAEWFAGKIGTVSSFGPIDQSIAVQASGPLVLSNGSAVQLALQLSSPSEETHLNASISTIDLFPPVAFTFSQDNGTGDYTSTLTIVDKGLAPGIYYVTIGIFSTDVIVSQVVEVDVQ